MYFFVRCNWHFTRDASIRNLRSILPRNANRKFVINYYWFLAHDSFSTSMCHRIEGAKYWWHGIRQTISPIKHTYCFRLQSGSICHLTNIYDQFNTHYDFTPPTNSIECLFSLTFFLILIENKKCVCLEKRSFLFFEIFHTK